MRKISTIILIAFIFCTGFAFADSIGNVGLNTPVQRAISLWGKPTSEKNISNSAKKYRWDKEKVTIYATAENGKISFIRASSGIGIEKEIKNFYTSRNIYLGSPEKKIQKAYGGKGGNDYQYESEDSLILNYSTKPGEVTVFRIYGFGKKGPRVIDIIITRPEYPKDKVFADQ